MTAPERIWYNGHSQDSRELIHTAPTSDVHPKFPYILATPAALAASPEVQALIAAERERCAVAERPSWPKCTECGGEARFRDESLCQECGDRAYEIWKEDEAAIRAGTEGRE